ncbi:MAG: methyltransferase [Candidatus Dojkabacteria bacterium]|jgi:23S rRNA G2445 N2-methylase RlmL|nr:methyltransferase [Candidatus Dojkabacteria bacterium]
MSKTPVYKLSSLKGVEEFVLKELLEKYPEVDIESKSSKEILFKSEQEDINIFRNLYSPVQIENENGVVLNLSKREWRKSYVPAGINPSLAYILCMIAELKEQDIVYDPFCGASVIPITALKYFNVKRVICSDISSRAIEKSMFNFQNTGIGEEKFKLFKSDIKDVTLNKKNIDKIISNLPFGIRVGTHDDNVSSYMYLENLADRLLRTKGKLVLLTQEKKLLRETFKKEKWKVKSVLRADEGGLLPEVFIIERRG